MDTSRRARIFHSGQNAAGAGRRGGGGIRLKHVPPPLLAQPLKHKALFGPDFAAFDSGDEVHPLIREEC
ncbi:hypothetical protein [Saccharopolyspora sp. 5N708]|uniref:hypothetical protein n=1 Tax=Saccharopolyspora sp. 5N708 TaxID=3457424 RepID=UPI003FD140D0